MFFGRAVRLPLVGLLAVVTLTATGCATTPSPGAKASPQAPVQRSRVAPAEPLGVQPVVPPDGTVLYRWVQLVSASVEVPTGSTEPQLLARAIVANHGGTASCPDYTLDGGSPSALHERPNTLDAKVFPILVCEIVVPASAQSLTVDGQSFDFLPFRDPLGQRIFIVGDTGCRDTSENPCTGGTEVSMWGFPAVVDQIEQRDPTVVVHVGDYIYRQVWNTPACKRACETGSCDYDLCDSWANWEADFFAPARGLLDQVPWVLSRGNHEECSQTEPASLGGPGWFLLLDPHTPCLTPGCAGPDAPTCDTQTGHSEPYALDLDFDIPGASPPTGLHTLRLLMMDSSDAHDNTASTGFDGDFRTLRTLAADADTAWLVTHRPLFGIRDGSDSSAIQTQDQELQQANADEPLPDNVGHIVSGHMHLFETTNLTPAATSPSVHLPSQIIVGDSGVDLVDAGVSGLGFEAYSGTARSQDVIAGAGLSGVLYRIHGFLTVEPAAVASGSSSETYTWNGTLIDNQGDAKLTCTLTASDGGGTASPGSRVDCQQTSSGP